MASKIGLSLRLTQEKKYSEERDALAHDWYEFMAENLPEVSWILMPNIGPRIFSYIKSWNIDGFILTGGNDLGESLLRDETEKHILEFALANKFPAFGVCRGMQMIQHYFGGELKAHADASHIAKNHFIKLVASHLIPQNINKKYEVNSFHNFGVKKADLAAGLEALALTRDGLWIEALAHSNEKVAGIQWHPERKGIDPQLSCQIIRKFFGLEKGN